MQARHIRRPALPWIIALALALAGALASCSDDGGTNPPGGNSDATLAGEAQLYDGSFFPSIGPFHITDMRSRLVVAKGDTVDVYAAMEKYETRNLTVYHRAGETDRPVVLFVHGGGWTDGYMDWYDFVAESFTGSLGYVTVVINYRLTSDSVFTADLCPSREGEIPDPSMKAATYPDNLDDCADALQWVLDSIAAYGGDPDAVFLFGHSAGGHLISLLTTHPSTAALRGRIRGVISMSGVYDLGQLNMMSFASVLDQTFGTHTDSAVLAEASPSTYVVEEITLPPFLILYSEDELPSLTSQALAFSTRLSTLGLEVETEYLAGYGHVSEMEAIASATEEPTARIAQFIEEHL